MGQSLKKLMFVVIFLMILLVACQAKITNQSNVNHLLQSTEIHIPSIKPSSVVSETSTMATPDVMHEPTQMKESRPIPTLIERFSKSSSLRGKLIIKDEQSHFMLDFDQGEILNLHRSNDCDIYQYDSNVVCLSNGTLIHFRENQSLTTLLSGSFTKKHLNSDFLALFENLENYKTNIYAYSLVDDTLQKIYSFDLLKESWLVLPKLSNNTMKIAGVKYIGPWNNELSLLDLQNNEEYRMSTQPPFFMTYNVTWSPTDKYILVGASDVHTEIGFCSNRLIVYEANEFSKIYDLINKEIKCFDDFDKYAYLISSSIWSPDETKLALVADNQYLCIGDLPNQSIPCMNMGNQVLSAAWSLDMKYVAVLTENTDKQIVILDIETKEIVFTYLIENELTGKRFAMDWQK